MEDNQTPDTLYLKGFNEGYLIARHFPAFEKTLIRQTPLSLRTSGFHDGQKQYIIEQTKTRLPSWLTNDRSTNSKDKHDKNKDRDIESRE